MERYVLRAVVIVALLAAAATTLRSQAPTFDVASVRMNRSGFPGGASGLRPGQFSARNETLRQLIRVAYRLETFRILGGPDWMDADRFDIQARAAMDVPRDQMLLMLQSLLTERFRLAAHKETRDLPIYELVVNRRDGKTGTRLRPASPGTCTDRGQQPVGVPAGQLPSCGVLLAGPDRMSGRRVSLALLATQLSARVSRVVVDRTGRAEMFDLDLEWTPDDAERAAVAALTPGGGPPPVDPDRPGIFTALDEQLGLKLEPARGPIEILVIAGAERPVEN
jgi:uncharacterized protein (TIGR03435 family)